MKAASCGRRCYSSTLIGRVASQFFQLMQCLPSNSVMAKQEKPKVDFIGRMPMLLLKSIGTGRKYLSWILRQ